MVEVIIAAVILGVTLSFMVGPVFLLLLEIAMNKGAKRALAFDAGVLLADVLFILLILYSSSFLKDITNLAWVYGIGGVVIMIFGLYNIRMAKKKKHHLDEEDELPAARVMSPFLYAVKGFFMNFLNVGVLAYWLATVVVMRATVDNDSEKMKVYFIVTVATYANGKLIITDISCGIDIKFANKIQLIIKVGKFHIVFIVIHITFEVFT